jgi:hypothetical protein
MIKACIIFIPRLLMENIQNRHFVIVMVIGLLVSAI